MGLLRLDESSTKTHIALESRRFAIPIFEFICSSCGNEFEELVFSSGEDVPCPKCESGDIKRKPSAFAMKSGDKFVSSSGSSCSGCSPGPGGCSGCSH